MDIRQPDEQEFTAICRFIEAFELDNRNLKREEFLAAFRHHELVGFGRLRDRGDCIELCSLGVVTPFRRKGIGRAITKALVEKASGTVYLVCIIPQFFQPLGFTTVDQYPSSMKEKKSYCTSELAVPETYVVMKKA